MVPGTGPSPCDICVLGEAPGAQEQEIGRPFVGAAGAELWHLLEPLGRTRDDVYTTNVIKEHPPDNRDPLPEEIEQWRCYLEDELCQVRPQLVIALGKVAASWCLGREIKMEREYGLLCDWPVVRGAGRAGTYPRLPDWPADLAPPQILVSYHPAAALHSPEIYTQLWWGFRRLEAWMAGDRTPHGDRCPFPVYQNAPEGPSAPLYGHPTGPIGVDTEGVLESPLGASWSFREGTGYWQPQGPSVTFEGVVVMQNALYDIPMVGALGHHLHGPVEDTMLMAHFLGEPRVGLKMLAYRHLGMTLTDYEDMVGPAQREKALAYLTAIMQAYEPQYEERVSEKTGRVLTPKQLPAGPVFKAAARCLNAKDPYAAWSRQDSERHREAEALLGHAMPEATLDDITT